MRSAAARPRCRDAAMPPRRGRVTRATAVQRIVVTDSVPPLRVPEGRARQKLQVLPLEPLLADAIRRLHHDGSLVVLL